MNAFLWTSLAAVFVWSGRQPHDRLTWLLEVLPVLIGVVILIAIHKRFVFSGLVRWLLWVHAIVLLVGGHYTYAKVPLGFWAEKAFDLSRNHYDRLGHFMQGFVPAMVAREVLVRKKVFNQGPPARRSLGEGGWLFFVMVCISMAISSVYEIIEWLVALGTETGAHEFLGTQGDVWDTQADMACALVGAVVSIFFSKRLRD